MKYLSICFIFIASFSTSVLASNPSTCQFLAESKQPNWINSAGRDSEYYYAVGGASGKQGGSYLEINQFINTARQDAINNLASSIRSGIKISTKRTIESKKEGKSKAEIRKEVNQKVEVVSQAALSGVIDDARWLDRENCLLWYRVKVSKAGAEFAVKAYVNDVAEKLHKKIEQLTKREIEEILTDNGFSATLPHATQALLNNSTAYYRGQSYNIAELYNQSGFEWLNSIEDRFYDRQSFTYVETIITNFRFHTKNNIPTAIVRSNSQPNKKITALKKLHSFGVDLNQVSVGIGTQAYLSDGMPWVNLQYSGSDYFDKNGFTYFKQQSQTCRGEIKSPFVYSFEEVTGEEKLGLLHFAIANRQNDLIEPLINLGVNVNQQSQFGYTPLAFAIESGQFSIAQQLLSLGADVAINDYLAYKIAYLFQHIENDLNLNLHQFMPGSSPKLTTFNTMELANTIAKMKLRKKVSDKLKAEIEKKFPIELKVTTTKKKIPGSLPMPYSPSDIASQTFINGVEVK